MFLKGSSISGINVGIKTYTGIKHEVTELTGEDSPQVSLTNDNLTFADVAAQWLSVASVKVKTSTYAGYIATLSRHILPSLGKHKMQALAAVDISCFSKEKLNNGRVDNKGGLSPKTVSDMLSIIKAVIDFAHDANIINRELSVTFPKNQRQTMRVLSRQEQLSLETILIENINIYKLGILLCLYTGLRIGEICALRWEDISGDFFTLSVRQTLQRVKDIGGSSGKTKILIDTPKSQCSLREIPIPKFISAYISKFSNNRYPYFLSTAAIIFAEPRHMQNHFKRSVKAAKIPAANFHSLRHTFATRCIEAGVDIKSISEMLGHTSVNFTLNRYVHSSLEQKREGMNKLEQYIGI